MRFKFEGTFEEWKSLMQGQEKPPESFGICEGDFSKGSCGIPCATSSILADSIPPSSILLKRHSYAGGNPCDTFEPPLPAYFKLAEPVSASLPDSFIELESVVNDPTVGPLRLPLPSPARRRRAWDKFKWAVAEWVKGFGVEGVPQPDRIALIYDLGTGQHTAPLLVMAYEMGSLQALVEAALIENVGDDKGSDWSKHPVAIEKGLMGWIDYVESIAANMVQLSNTGFPDLTRVFSISGTWSKQPRPVPNTGYPAAECQG